MLENSYWFSTCIVENNIPTRLQKVKYCQPRPQGFSLKKLVEREKRREKARASAGHVSPRTPLKNPGCNKLLQ